MRQNTLESYAKHEKKKRYPKVCRCCYCEDRIPAAYMLRMNDSHRIADPACEKHTEQWGSTYDSVTR